VLWPLLSFPIALFVVIGLGHFICALGRRAVWIVLKKAFTFLCLCCGYWTDDDVEAFGIHKKVFESSLVWSEPEVLLSIKKFGLQEKLDELRRSEAPTVAYEDIKALIPALTASSCRIQLRRDYNTVMYAAIGMRATLLQAMPYMTLLSVFATCTCANPMFVQSPNLKERMINPWCNKPWELARNSIKTRIKLEAGVRSDEIHEETHSLPNPEIDSSGVNVPVPVRNLIEKHNEMWRSHMKSLEGKHDVVNEWEVALKGLHMSVSNSNVCGFVIGCCKYVFVTGLLFSSSEHHNLLVGLSLLAFFPYCLIMSLPFILRAGVNMYISDADIKRALGWVLLPLNMFGYKFTWLSSTPAPTVTESVNKNDKAQSEGDSSYLDEYYVDNTSGSPMHDHSTTGETEMVSVNPMKESRKISRSNNPLQLQKALEEMNGTGDFIPAVLPDSVVPDSSQQQPHEKKHEPILRTEVSWQRNPINTSTLSVSVATPNSGETTENTEETKTTGYWDEMADDLIPAEDVPDNSVAVEYDVEKHIHDFIPNM